MSINYKQKKLISVLDDIAALSSIKTWNRGELTSSKELLDDLDAKYTEFVREYKNLIKHQGREFERRELAFRYQRMHELGFTASQIAEQEQLPIAVIKSLLAIPV